MENRITLQPAASVAPIGGGAHTTSIGASHAVARDDVGHRIAGRPRDRRIEQEARPRVHRAARDRFHAVAVLELRLRRVDRCDRDARRRPGIVVEGDAPAIGRRDDAHADVQQRPDQRRSQQQPRREPTTPTACAHRLSAILGWLSPTEPERKSRRHRNPGNAPRRSGATAARPGDGPRRSEVA